MAGKNFLNNITIPEPCRADWNSMVGNEQVRFCEHCSLDVHNLSAMTRSQAQRLVARSKGRLCVQYHSDSFGRPQTLSGQKLHRIHRRVSQIAAGAFTATLSITSTMAQQGASRSIEELPAQIAQANSRWSAGASVAGTVTDQHGAVIPGATIFLSNSEAQVALYASTAFDGQFKIEGLKSGIYKIRIDAPGFAADETDSLYLPDNREQRVDRTLSVAKVEEQVEVVSEGTEVMVISGGAVAIVSPEHPFVRAAQEDNLEALTTLIAGTDVNLRDQRSGTTALEHAVRNANREMTQLLLSHGAKVNAVNDYDETVLMMLDEDATSDLIWDLLNAGADVKLKDKGGNTALIQVADLNNLEAVRILLDAGAEVDARNEDGETALMRAASEGWVNNVRALVLAGADINASDNEKRNALAHAADNDHAAVARFLKSKGAVQVVAQARKDE